MDPNVPVEETRPARERHIFMLVLSLTVVGVILFVSYLWGESLFGQSVAPQSRFIFLVPYLTNLGGVLIFIMNTARRKGETWKLRAYWGDHCFRIAQSFAYLFIVMWAWSQADQESTGVSTSVPLNILGFLVGLFILRVERAMEGLGDKFEQVLMTILPRATQYMTAEEKRRQQLRTIYRVDDIATEYQVLRTQIVDPAARAKLDLLLDETMQKLEGDDPDQTRAAADQLMREFAEIKQGLGEVWVPVEDLLRPHTDPKDCEPASAEK